LKESGFVSFLAVYAIAVPSLVRPLVAATLRARSYQRIRATKSV
jgi:hypothetical protein